MDSSPGKKTLRLDKLLDVLEVLGLELAVEEGHGRLRVPEAPRAARS